MKSAVQHFDAEEGTCDVGHLSPHCAEQQLFHSWRAEAIAEDLMHLEGFLQEEHPPALVPAAADSTTPSDASVTQRMPMAAAATPPPPSSPMTAAPPARVRGASVAVASVLPSSAPGAAAGVGLLE